MKLIYQKPLHFLGQVQNVCDAFGHKWNWDSKSSKMMPLDFSGPGDFSWREPHSETNR